MRCPNPLLVELWGREVSDIEFFAALNPKRLTSLDEDFKAWRKEMQEDSERNALRKAGKLQPDPVETTYERFETEL